MGRRTLIGGLLVIFSLTASGCATIAGTAVGPITGTVSCAAAGVAEIVNRGPDRAWAPLLIIFSPIVGFVGSVWEGIKTDLKGLTGRPVYDHDFKDVLLPCGSH